MRATAGIEQGEEAGQILTRRVLVEQFIHQDRVYQIHAQGVDQAVANVGGKHVDSSGGGDLQVSVSLARLMVAFACSRKFMPRIPSIANP